MGGTIPRPVRRWTLLIVSHDSEAPRSFSVTERRVRAAAGAFAVLVLVAMVGVGTIIARVGRIATPPLAPAVAVTSPPAGEVVQLQSRVGELQNLIDSIDLVDDSLARLTGSSEPDSAILRRLMARLPALLSTQGTAVAAVAPDPATARATADSLLRHARGVTARLRALDSAARRVPANAPRADQVAGPPFDR